MDSDLPHIPSELLEPTFMRLIGEWFEMFEHGDLTGDQMLSRMWGLCGLASKAGAIHADLAITKDIFRLEGYFKRMKEKS